jgi:glycosyltransferase involved in cell wall biosynthesis
MTSAVPAVAAFPWRTTPAGEIPVAVVIPCYNYAGYVAECIDSVAAQSHQPVDLLVYDDGSTDGSVGAIDAAMRRHAGRFREATFEAPPRNAGKLHALNMTLPRVTAPITVILDADDILHRDFLSVLVHELQVAHLECGASFTYCDCILMDAAGVVVAEGNSMSFDPTNLEEISYIPDCAPTLTGVLMSALPFDTSIRVATKHHKWLRIVRAGHSGHYVKRRLFSYRMHGTNMSGIGARVLDDLASGSGRERILSEYWGTAPTREKV